MTIQMLAAVTGIDLSLKIESICYNNAVVVKPVTHNVIVTPFLKYASAF
jgi:hypothetical protein